MSLNNNFISIFKGSHVKALSIVEKLEAIDIKPIVKNEGESARLAGFGSSYAGEVEIYVHADEHEKALIVLEVSK